MNSIARAAVRGGNANRIRSAVTRMFQVKIGIRNMRHARALAGVDRGDEVDRAEDTRDADEGQPDDPQVEPDAGLSTSASVRGA